MIMAAVKALAATVNPQLGPVSLTVYQHRLLPFMTTKLLLTEAGEDLVLIFTNMRWIKRVALLIRYV
jgi:hypothetical protein